MPLERSSGNPATLPLENRVARDGTAAEIAAGMAAICREINAALAPIIGIGRVDALHARSRHLCTASHAWVAGLESASSSGCDALETLLKQREPSEALSGGEACLQVFHELLVSLMGASLAERQLQTVWMPVSNRVRPTARRKFTRASIILI